MIYVNPIIRFLIYFLNGMHTTECFGDMSHHQTYEGYILSEKVPDRYCSLKMDDASLGKCSFFVY